MKIINLTEMSEVYTSNVYLVLGTWNSIGDVNTLVDVGRDPRIIDLIEKAPTGVGKKRIEQVVLTHSHYDHVSMLPQVCEAFNPVVYAFSHSLKGTHHQIADGQIFKIGDRKFELIHMPGHSSDSICIYCEEDGVLFAGDSPLLINSCEDSHETGFVNALERICERNVNVIYFGHGKPLSINCNGRLASSLINVRKSLEGACQ